MPIYSADVLIAAMDVGAAHDIRIAKCRHTSPSGAGLCFAACAAAAIRRLGQLRRPQVRPCRASHEALFTEVHDEHVRHLPAVPGVRSIRRSEGVRFTVAIAGGQRPMPAPAPACTAINGIDDPSVPASPAWAETVEKRRSAKAVRPHTRHRHQARDAVRPPLAVA